MAVLLSETIRPSRRMGLFATPIERGPEGANQTFKKGAPLVYSSGYLVVGAADLTSGLVGFAESDGHNAAAGTKEILYTPALPHIIFEVTLEDAANLAHALAQTNLGPLYALQTDGTTLAWFADENDTANGILRVVKLLSPIGTVRGKVEVVVVADATIYGT